MPIDNGSGYAGGTYASPEQAAEYRAKMTSYLAMRNGRWLDRWQDPHTGEFPPGIGELANAWQADSHLVKWCIRQGLIHPDSIKPDGLQHRQIGRLTAIVYNMSPAHHRALAWELAAYLDSKESQQSEVLKANGDADAAPQVVRR